MIYIYYLDNSIKEDVPLTIKEGGIIKDGYQSRK